MKYSLDPGVSTVTFGAAMNRKKFEPLPKDLQDLITALTGTAMAERSSAALDTGI